MYEEDVLDDTGFAEPPAATVDDIISAVQASDGEWQTLNDPIEFAGFLWLPHLVKVDKRSVLYVHLAGAMRPFLVRRLMAAKEAGFSVNIAIDLLALSDSETLLALSKVDAYVHLFRGSEISPGVHVLAALSDESVAVAASTKRIIARRAWDLRDDGTSQEKGRRLEALLAFLLAQVDDFVVKERNFRGDTDEIDVILQLSRVSARCWYSGSSPFILVEAKNWAVPVPQKEISAFIFKLQTKRGRSKIGLFFSKGGYTSDAQDQELKLAATDLVVVLIGPEEIVEWISHDEPDEYLESKVRYAMLR